MAKRPPSTPALRTLRQAGIEFSVHLFDYRSHPGAEGAAEALDIPVHRTVKTIVLTTDDGDGVVVLMHGDMEVSTKKVARAHGAKSLRLATQKEADRFTGYVFGGTSPLGMRSDLPVYVHETIPDLDQVWVNAGSRGFLVGLSPLDLISLCDATRIDAAVD